MRKSLHKRIFGRQAGWGERPRAFGRRRTGWLTTRASAPGGAICASARRRSALPEAPRRDRRTLGHRRELRPDDIGIDRRLADPCAVAAVAAGHHVLATDALGVAADALGDELGMLDEVRLRFDDA